MTDSVIKSLTRINNISRQLLSRIQDLHADLQAPSQNQADEDDVNNSGEMIVDTELKELMLSRQRLITELFEQHALAEITAQHLLANEMKSLDGELLNLSQLYKHVLAEQVINIKKRKK
ncbi:hypothetical protein L3081_16005 [Colwellia sp. MSW7]|uniref:Uncharacterized protein n=1 Tax=Colwellia maritima TaxID=2912588 RepID=A0ABS9X365_9GAMM|nr:hypothetical protein [Colwellia maritima]MCI2284619.1 hypothetical protein [Colwellia maritima]